MKGYTIENSIDLLEKDVKALKEGGGGGGGASTWNQLQGKPFSSLGEELYNLDGDLTVNIISADKIALPESTEHSWDYLSQAIEALAEDVNHFSDDISDLEANKQDTLTAGDNITIENNVISASGGGGVRLDSEEHVVGYLVDRTEGPLTVYEKMLVQRGYWPATDLKTIIPNIRHLVRVDCCQYQSNTMGNYGDNYTMNYDTKILSGPASSYLLYLSIQYTKNE